MGNAYVLKVTKGIHQPTTDPHLQLTLFEADGTTKISAFHLNLTADEKTAQQAAPK